MEELIIKKAQKFLPYINKMIGETEDEKIFGILYNYVKTKKIDQKDAIKTFKRDAGIDYKPPLNDKIAEILRYMHPKGNDNLKSDYSIDGIKKNYSLKDKGIFKKIISDIEKAYKAYVDQISGDDESRDGDEEYEGPKSAGDYMRNIRKYESVYRYTQVYTQNKKNPKIYEWKNKGRPERITSKIGRGIIGRWEKFKNIPKDEYICQYVDNNGVIQTTGKDDPDRFIPCKDRGLINNASSSAPTATTNAPAPASTSPAPASTSPAPAPAGGAAGAPASASAPVTPTPTTTPPASPVTSSPTSPTTSTPTSTPPVSTTSPAIDSKKIKGRKMNKKKSSNRKNKTNHELHKEAVFGEQIGKLPRRVHDLARGVGRGIKSLFSGSGSQAAAATGATQPNSQPSSPANTAAAPADTTGATQPNSTPAPAQPVGLNNKDLRSFYSLFDNFMEYVSDLTNDDIEKKSKPYSLLRKTFQNLILIRKKIPQAYRGDKRSIGRINEFFNNIDDDLDEIINEIDDDNISSFQSDVDEFKESIKNKFNKFVEDSKPFIGKLSAKKGAAKKNILGKTLVEVSLFGKKYPLNKYDDQFILDLPEFIQDLFKEDKFNPLVLAYLDPNNINPSAADNKPASDGDGGSGDARNTDGPAAAGEQLQLSPNNQGNIDDRTLNSKTDDFDGLISDINQSNNKEKKIQETIEYLEGLVNSITKENKPYFVFQFYKEYKKFKDAISKITTDDQKQSLDKLRLIIQNKLSKVSSDRSPPVNGQPPAAAAAPGGSGSGSGGGPVAAASEQLQPNNIDDRTLELKINDFDRLSSNIILLDGKPDERKDKIQKTIKYLEELVNSITKENNSYFINLFFQKYSWFQRSISRIITYEQEKSLNKLGLIIRDKVREAYRHSSTAPSSVKSQPPAKPSSTGPGEGKSSKPVVNPLSTAQSPHFMAQRELAAEKSIMDSLKQGPNSDYLSYDPSTRGEAPDINPADFAEEEEDNAKNNSQTIAAFLNNHYNNAFYKTAAPKQEGNTVLDRIYVLYRRGIDSGTKLSNYLQPNKELYRKISSLAKTNYRDNSQSLSRRVRSDAANFQKSIQAFISLFNSARDRLGKKSSQNSNYFSKTANYEDSVVNPNINMTKKADKVSKKYYQDAISGLDDQYAKSYYAGLKGMYDKKPQKTKADYKKLYQLHDETGTELIGSAHPKTIDIAEAMGNGGIVENQIEQQRHNIGVAKSMPSGNFQGKHAWVIHNLVKLANHADEIGDLKSSDLIDDAIEELKKL